MTQPEQGNNQTTKIVLGALAILVMAAALYWYFTSLRPEANLEEPSQVIVEPVAPNQAADVTTDSEEVTPLPSLEEAQTTDLSTSEGGVGVGTELATAPAEGINPDVPLAGVPNTNPFKPLRIESGEEGLGALQPLLVDNNEPTFDDAADSNSTPSFSAPSAPISTPSTSDAPSSPSNPSSPSSDWDFGETGPVILEQPATANTPSSDTSELGADTSWDFGPNSAGSPNAAGNGGSSNDSDTSTNAPSKPTGVIAGMPSKALPTGFGNEAASGVGAGSNVGAESNVGLMASQPSGSASEQALSFIKQYGAASVAAPDDGTRLSRILNARNYHFSGAVLGTVDTAIFKSVSGFNVVEEGEQLPGTDVIVREIDENRVVLALGDESVTLDLESLEKF